MFITYSKNQPNQKPHQNSLQTLIQNKINHHHSSISKNGTKDRVRSEDVATFDRDKSQEIFRVIDKYACRDNQGYFNYQAWLQLNQQMFGEVEEDIMMELWKVVRVINYGDVLIPTGLVYEIVYHFRYYGLPVTKGWSLRSILNRYLQRNRQTDSVKTFRQLANYLELEDIQKAFCRDYFNDNNKNEQQNKENKEAIFKRLHQQSSKRKISLYEKQYKTIVKEIKQCSFAPKINTYHSIPQVNQRQKTYRKYKFNSLQIVKQQPLISQFKSRPIDKKIYECNLLSIPGTNEHISRNQSCQAQRQMIKRYMQRPIKKLY